jgi:hypothetical protein
MAREVGPLTAAAIAFCTALAALAICFGGACLVGVRRADAMFETGQAQRAFEAVKHRAGPRMQVRTLDITPRMLTVWAADPDMSPWRFTPSTRQHSSHTVFVPDVKEQSWRVTHWTVFSHDWYQVSGPEPEGRIEESRGPAFDLKPEDMDLPSLTRTAIQSVARGTPAQVLSVTMDSQRTSVSVNSLKGISTVLLKRHDQ